LEKTFREPGNTVTKPALAALEEKKRIWRRREQPGRKGSPEVPPRRYGVEVNDRLLVRTAGAKVRESGGKMGKGLSEGARIEKTKSKRQISVKVDVCPALRL